MVDKFVTGGAESDLLTDDQFKAIAAKAHDLSSDFPLLGEVQQTSAAMMSYQEEHKAASTQVSTLRRRIEARQQQLNDDLDSETNGITQLAIMDEQHSCEKALEEISELENQLRESDRQANVDYNHIQGMQVALKKHERVLDQLVEDFREITLGGVDIELSSEEVASLRGHLLNVESLDKLMVQPEIQIGIEREAAALEKGVD